MKRLPKKAGSYVEVQKMVEGKKYAGCGERTWRRRDTTDLRSQLSVRPYLHLLYSPISSSHLCSLFASAAISSFKLRFRQPKPQRVRRNLTSTPVASMLSENPIEIIEDLTDLR
ncbi:hypothetical protein LOK49_LG07G02569 [Camellia lanceoleosa]|uniref:Uncharacterized protein n=1 Tax=Camellia lanceoleosa TaxID=1840588 RepID=A0ACC0H143_9ERIC|nr:hypothetical protein LOK49_LG07G02569 [Camellia lanceoleosa]